MKFKTNEFEIEFEEQSKELVEAKIRAWLKENPSYARLLLIVIGNKASSVTELTDLISKIEGKTIDRSEVHYMLKKLANHGLVKPIHIGDVLRDSQNNEISNLIKSKYFEFLKNIPQQFKTRFRNVFYFVPTDYGKKFIEWCGQVTKVKIKVLK
jgi:predicted transcriptional regulator